MKFLKKKNERSRSGGRSDDGSQSPSSSLTRGETIDSIMPANWDLSENHGEDLQLSHIDQDETTLCIHNPSTMCRTTVVSNMPIPVSQLKKLTSNRHSRGELGFPGFHHQTSAPVHQHTAAITRSIAPDFSNLFAASPSAGRRSSNTGGIGIAGDGGGIYPTVEPSPHNFTAPDKAQVEAALMQLQKDSLYYFEVTTQELPKGCDACVGVVLDKIGSSAGQFVPGETQNSIGLDSLGILRVNGKVVHPSSLQQSSESFSGNRRFEAFDEGDVIGCAVEISGSRRVFFTKNGKIIVPPTKFADLEIKKALLCPAFGVKVTQGHSVQASANFGLDCRRPFIWEFSAYLAYQCSNGHSPASQEASNSSGTPPPPFRSRHKKKGISRQQSAPESGPALSRKIGSSPGETTRQNHGSASPSANRQIRGNQPRPNADRDALSLSPATGLFQRNRRMGKRRGAPAIAMSRRDSEPDDISISEFGDVATSTHDLMSASTSRLDSEWQTNGSSSGFIPSSSGVLSLDFGAISEHERSYDPFAAPPEEGYSLSGGTEEEKNAMEDVSDAYIAPAGVLTPKDFETMRENASNLRSISGDGVDADDSFIQTFLDCCKADKQSVAVAVDKAMLDESPNLMALFELNEIILEAIELGTKAIEVSKKKSFVEVEPTRQQRRNSNLDLDINGLIRKKDIFSLICILRAQSDQRLDAALALMEFAQDGERSREDDCSLRDEIRSSGGIHSLLQVFRAQGTPYELRVVSGMAVAYVIPSLVKASPGVGLKIMECLRFLSVSRSVTPNGVSISQETMFKASAMGVFSFWMNVLEPLLASQPFDDESAAENTNLQITTSPRFAAAGGIFDQGHERLELQELLEMTVSLIVQIQKHCDSECATASLPCDEDLSMWRYTNVEQVCTVDVARPIAVREGLLPILVDWIKSDDKDKKRPAVSALRYLTSIKDKYMAGWIHSQMVNEGALSEVVKLADDYNVGSDVRLAVAQILSSLCVAPHTRAAVVEARCMFYLIGFLYDHTNPASEEVALFAGHAITQLAAGAITRASVFGGGDTEILDFVSPDKRDSLIDDIVNNGAGGSFIAIALESDGQLRAMAIEAIRVLSEDRSPNRRTRLQFIEDGAAKALGRALEIDVAKLNEALQGTSNVSQNAGDNGFFFKVLESVFSETHDALCGLANLLEPVSEQKNSDNDIVCSSSTAASTQVVLHKGCMDTAESGGLASLLRISTMSLAFPGISPDFDVLTRSKILLREACRSLSSLAPLLLTDRAAEEGCAKWTVAVLSTFNKILAAAVVGDEIAQTQELFSVLCGLEALATCAPLRIRIIDEALSSVLRLKNIQGDHSDVANIAGQVFYTLGFSEEEIAVQVAGSNPSLLTDWFCLQRSLIIQAMVRAEIKKKLSAIWCHPFAAITNGLSHEQPVPSFDGGDRHDTCVEIDIFENFADDEDTFAVRESMLHQYRNVYASTGSGTTVEILDDEFSAAQETMHHLANQSYPFNDEHAEIDWILCHEKSTFGIQEQNIGMDISLNLPEHLDTLLDCCMPSKLLRNHILPIFSFQPDASFNFRAIMMPQRQYYSFRREAQMVSRLCDIQPEGLEFDEVHWTLGFSNSTFAGEFSESLVQALYLCPTIRGISFARDSGFKPLDAVDDMEGEGGSVLLAKLVGSVPPWIDYLTFKNIFSDREIRSLVAILERMGKLSAAQDSDDELDAARGRGRFRSFAITHSPLIAGQVWQTFLGLLGQTQHLSNQLKLAPLSSLVDLDLSFNELGDEACALVLELAHNEKSGCKLEQVDLSGNCIGKGQHVIKILRAYIDEHRYIPTIERRGWGSQLHTLNLASNSLGVSNAGAEIISCLKFNALGLKVLDLADNGIYHGEDDYYFSQVLSSALGENTRLVHLNLSGNRLSSNIIDDTLKRLLSNPGSSRLCFLGIERNSPPISQSQIQCIESFLMSTRVAVLKQNTSKAHLTQQEDDDDDWIYELKVDNNEPQLVRKSSRKSVAVQPATHVADTTSRGSRGENMITVLFSAPLVFTDDQRQLRPFKKLDFDMERELMWQCMKEAARDIELSFDNATHDRLLAAMTKRCSCLHYSGHGHQMYLPFEDGTGGPNWFKVDDIRSLISREGAAPFKFVFVSACHSGLAGATFASAGVPHVVCCQQEFELKDTAALAFTRQFYLSLAVGHTVRESFEQGCRAVRATPNLKDAESEMKKFLLLPKDANHDVPIFNASSVPEWPMDKGSARHNSTRRSLRKSKHRTRSMFGIGAKQSELSVRNMMQEDPSPTPPQFFLGREVDMYFVLKLILTKRLVSVVGESGIGRSSMVCAVCHYINERASTILAIEKMYFVKAKKGRQGGSCRSLLEQLQRKIVESEAGKGEVPERGADMEDMYDFICTSLKNEKALLVFDRMELLGEISDDEAKGNEMKDFLMFLDTIFRGTKNVRVLLTGRRQLGRPSLGGQVESTYTLGPLNYENTVRLFANLCPHLHTEGERYKLYQHLVEDYGQALLRPVDVGLDRKTKAVFALLGDGVPSMIEKAAYEITAERLQELVAAN